MCVQTFDCTSEQKAVQKSSTSFLFTLKTATALVGIRNIRFTCCDGRDVAGGEENDEVYILY